jgi:multiple sugar transport system substrate-binding protein
VRARTLWILCAALLLAVLTLPATAQAPVTVVHWQHFHEGRANALRGLVQVFERQNPGIRVQTDLPPYEQYFAKLLSSLAAGTGPDVFQIAMENAEQFINAGFLAPVPASVATPEFIRDNYLSWTTERFRRGSQYYGLPTDVQHLVMYINDELAREAGLDPARPPETWDDLIAAARRATKRDAAGNIVQAGLDTRYRWAVYSALLYQYVEGPVIDARTRRATYDSPQGIAAWKVAETLLRGPAAVDSPRFLPGQRKWEFRRAVFYINHPVNRSVIAALAPDIKYTIAPIPRIAGKKLVVPGHHWAYVVNAKSRNVEAAWKWVSFLTSRTGQRTWMKNAGDLPATPSLLPEEPNPVVRDSLKFVRPVDYVGVCDPIRNDLWDAIALTTTPVEQLVRAAVDKENACVAEALK